jgi:beta-1,4-mannosyl-glycoprotein beta-1,4-N-acetylglucosaminyltransferase
MKKKIIDCFLFNDEIEMLNFRLHELNENVDYFLILESNKSFDGSDKKYFFDENKDNFEKFKDKIIHLKLFISDISSPKEILNFYHKNLSEKIKSLDLQFEDIIFYSDVDEIPDLSKLNEIINLLTTNPVVLIQENFFWNKSYISSVNHYGTYVFSFSHFLCLKDIFKGHILGKRNFSSDEHIICGWHFSNFFSSDECFIKIKTLFGLSYNDSFYENKNNIENLRQNLFPLFQPNPTPFFRLKKYVGELPKNHELLPNYDVGRKESVKFVINIDEFKSQIDIPQIEYYSNEKTQKFGFEFVYFLNEIKKELYKFYPIDDDVFLFPEMNKELAWQDIKNSFLSELLLN